MSSSRRSDPESLRVAEAAARLADWHRWGPYLAERQWGTVREDYSANGDAWGHLSHDHARSRAYRWGEDGLLGIADRQCRLCFAVALWNGKDPFLKERLYGLTNPEGNHGEDVKEAYFYLDATPTSSYLKGLYKYPQSEFPYRRLVEENRRRNRHDWEFELADSGVFAQDRYFDIVAEYAKAAPDDLQIQLTAVNRGPDPAPLWLLPTVWFRNTWAWKCTHEGCWPKGLMYPVPADGSVRADHPSLGRYRIFAGPGPENTRPEWMFTDNETNLQRLYNVPNAVPFVKDGIHRAVVNGEAKAVNPHHRGTKAAAAYQFTIPPGGRVTVQLRLVAEDHVPAEPFGTGFDQLFARRKAEADLFHQAITPKAATSDEAAVARQAYAGLLWTRQFYHYVINPWLDGDPGTPKPPEVRKQGRNRDWGHLFNKDIISVPDKWEYPYYCAWDLAYHMVAYAPLDADFAKRQLLLFLREWYMHPNGQLPAYEFDFSDANPPVHAWACWRVYLASGKPGKRDRDFLERAFAKLLINFTWWVNRKDVEGRNVFGGGFLGLDNIGVFDRSRPLPGGARLDQADGTAWMAFYCTTMLTIALELAKKNRVYEDIASKFFEHFLAIALTMNTFGKSGLWDETDGFFYDQFRTDGAPPTPLRVRSVVGVIPLFATSVIPGKLIERLPGFSRRMKWLLANNPELARMHARIGPSGRPGHENDLMLSILGRFRLMRVLRRLLDETEFLSDHGVRSLSKKHSTEPFVFRCGGEENRVAYLAGESDSGMFGGNSNWRGPVWFPINHLLIEALLKYHRFFGDEFQVEYPTGSGRFADLGEVADAITARLVSLFLPGEDGTRPCLGPNPGPMTGPDGEGLVLFHEYFDGDSGRGLGASHQTGWTSLVAPLIAARARRRSRQVVGR